MKGKRIIVGLCFMAEAALCLYCCFLAYVSSGWFVDDGVAVRMQSGDWVRTGAARFVEWLIVAAILAAGTFACNRYVLGLSARVARWVALPALLLIITSSLVGLLRFVWERPFM